jgi:hypothetical protein
MESEEKGRLNGDFKVSFMSNLLDRDIHCWWHRER